MEDRPEVGRNGTAELHRLAGLGMPECETLGVERLMIDLGEEERGLGARARRKAEQGTAPPAVLRVTEHGMAQMRAVHADLVRAPGLQLQRELGKVALDALHPVACP